ncbi:hypothetical protein DFH05DRAFT_1475965 [Lentinula detonsa]|uniref:RING-type domain-containing protein n=1 Tax=Lentinula detonsa TaxID=2804962 RepID=A0A9W8P8P1_9AGAR|nr:hypothetical protein DFH05DRAFT_1475965 [Lentinula detonsa]
MPSTRASLRNSTPEVQLDPINTKQSSKNKISSAASKPTIVHREIIEISDSDDDVLFSPRPPSLKRKNSHELQLERDLKKLKQENDEHKNKETLLRSELARFQNELALLRSTLPNAASSKAHVPISEVEDSVTCEVCTMKMWTPYILECGHSYCQSCLQDWFSTTLMQHMAAHPHYNPNQPPHGAAMYLAYGQHYNYMPHLLGATVPQPQYTCPTCREQVRNPPVEDFNLKNVVRAVASVQGEASPKKAEAAPSQRKGKEKGKALAKREDPWSGFFPKRT